MKSFLNIQQSVFFFGAMLASAAISQGAITLTIEEYFNEVVGKYVVDASYSGSLDTTDMGFGPTTEEPPTGITPNAGEYGAINSRVGSSPMISTNTWNERPPAFGSGTRTSPSVTVTRDSVFGFGDHVYLSDDYTSGSSMSGLLQFEDTDFSAMGINPGTYTGEFASGDTLTINVIPEPNSYGFLLGVAGLATAIFFRRRRRSSAA